MSVGPIQFEVTNQDDAAIQVVKLALERHGLPVRLANAYSVAVASSDPEYLSLFRSEGINYPDGSPIEWFMRLFSSAELEPRRVRGPSLFNDVLDRGRSVGIRHSFVGTTDETLRQLALRAEQRYAGLKIAGMYSPPYSDITEEFLQGISKQVKSFECDLVWIALGTPKQDFAAYEIAKRTGLPCVAVGAAFDFLAGTTAEAPLIFQRAGLEWAYRLITEPKRLWRRYTIGNVIFLRCVMRPIIQQQLIRAREWVSRIAR